jgi:hypothetical protein
MGSRWTFKAKTDQHGGITRLRARFVCQGFSQVKDVSYWESFSPVVSFTTIRLLIALTALPHWHAIHYDVSVPFITAEIDPAQPPIYCRPAEGYESRTESVYLLKRYLYGMKDSPRGYNLHFNSVCLNYGLKRCISDECVYIKIESNDKRNKETPSASLDVLTSQTTCIAPEYRIHKDCYYALRIIIVSTYVDDNLIFTNSRTFADEFADDDDAHCNKSLKMNLEGDLTWYLSVLYTRCPIDDESTLPHLPFGCFWLRLKKEKKKISNRMKKISYQSRRNLLQPQTDKNPLRKWSRFCNGSPPLQSPPLCLKKKIYILKI